MADINSSMTELSPTFTCALTPQYINVFKRSIPYSATIVLCILNIVFIVIATSLNLLIMASIISTPKLQTPTFILLCNLALTDFIIGLVVCSCEVVYLITRAIGQYDHFCTTWKVLVVLSYFLCPASLYTITCISYDRYLSLQMNVKYKTVVTKKKACVIVVLLWVCSLLGTTLMGMLGKTPFLVMVCCVTFFCLVVIIDCYLLSFAAIRKHQREVMSMSLGKKNKSSPGKRIQKENIRHNKGRKGIKRPVESFGQEYEERKKFAKSRDSEKRSSIGRCETRDFDEIGQWDSMDEDEEIYNENLSDLDSESEDAHVMEIKEETLESCLSIQKAKEGSGKHSSQTSSSVKRTSQLDIRGGKVRQSFDPSSKMKYILVKKDIENVFEKVELEEQFAQDSERADKILDEVKEVSEILATEQRTNETSIPRCSNTSQQQTDTSKLAIQKAQLLGDVKKFKQTLHTILLIVIALFLCYFPYTVVSAQVTLRILDIGIAWDVAGVIVYLNSSISPIIMCTRIASIREASRRILRKRFCRS